MTIQQEDTIQGWKDDSANLMRILKIIKDCPRCLAQLDKIGGLQITLSEENEQRIQKLAARKGVAVVDDDE